MICDNVFRIIRVIRPIQPLFVIKPFSRDYALIRAIRVEVFPGVTHDRC